MTTSISQEQLDIAKQYADAGDAVGGWAYLASIGDKYAVSAYMVVGQSNTREGVFLHDLVETHWNNTAGAGAYEDKFQKVAINHYKNYIDDIITNDLKLPTTGQVEDSYKKSVLKEGLGEAVAIDAVITRSVGVFTFGQIDWDDILGLEDERQSEGHAYDDIPPFLAISMLYDDIRTMIAEGKFNSDAVAYGAINLYLDSFDSKGDEDFVFPEIEAFAPNLVDEFRQGRSGAHTIQRYDPLTLDLDNDGLETTAAPAGVLFDHDGDGIAHGSGWIAADDGLLVLDRNGNGRIDTGAELFGDHTFIGTGRAFNGFAPLIELDANGDGRVDAQDAQFSALRVWRDLNQNGVSEGNELFSLASLGIRALNVAILCGLVWGFQEQMFAFIVNQMTL